MFLVFSALWSISLEEKLVIDADFLEVVSIFDGPRVLNVDVAPSSPPKSLTQKTRSFNDGSGDVGDSSSQFLLVRGLDTMLREEAIASGMARLDSEPKRVLLIRDRKTNVSWGFAFVEYQDVSVCMQILLD
jgi:RNA recognition motif-containing protein